MGKRNVKTSEEEPHTLKFKAYSVNEIMAAGGTTAFANKMGKSWGSLIDSLKKLPKDAFLTDEEVREALKTLNESK
jgi:hypothetical protein